MPSLKRFRQMIFLPVALVAFSPSVTAHAQGEPAADFLKRLRAAGYYDIAITYLDRLGEYPGVDPELKSASSLEKARTYIDAAVDTRTSSKRDDFFVKAEAALKDFLKQSSHPRLSEARLQLGRIQMVRGAQLTSGDPSPTKSEMARESYVAASKTFATILAELRGKLQEMKGAKIDAAKEPEKAKLRDQYRGQFLQAKVSAAEALRLAASTYKDPAKDGKELLEAALKEFVELSENYGGYVQGAEAMLNRGLVQETLGKKEEALDSFVRMLEQPDADPLRAAKYQAASGVIRLRLKESPPGYQSAIERGQPLVDGLRPNEKRLPFVQELRVELASAYLAKSKDEKQKQTDRKRAESSGRQLLIAASKVPTEFADRAKDLLGELGVSQEETIAELPTAEPPADLADALEKANELLSAGENIAESLKLLEGQKDKTPEIAEQIESLKGELGNTRVIAIQILRQGLAMINSDVDNDLLNQARQFLAYLLYEEQNYRDATVVGVFLSKNAPGTELGLRGGVIALNSMRKVLEEIPAGENRSMLMELADLGQYMASTWPDDPNAAAAKGVMITLALEDERWEDAEKLIDEMPDAPAKWSFHRLVGQLKWNEWIKNHDSGDEALLDRLLKEARGKLQSGLDGIKINVVEPEAIKAALVLAKVHLKLDQPEKAIAILDHEKYGPLKQAGLHPQLGNKFTSDMFGTELQVVVRLMSTEDDPSAMLNRATQAMDNLRDAVQGPDAEKRLTGIYLGMARDIREQIDKASPAKKAKLIEAFRVFLERVAQTTNESSTLTWVGQTLLELGQAAMRPGQIKAEGQAAQLIGTAGTTFETLRAKGGDVPLTVNFQLGKAYRLVGQYKQAIDRQEEVLKQKPMMLDAQVEAALAYEQWAAVVPPKFAGKAYQSALNGARPNPNSKSRDKDTIWGWGVISQRTNGNPAFRDQFFLSRYHVALCRYKWGKADNDAKLKEKAISDIMMVHGLNPDLGGAESRTKFDNLLKAIQKDLGKKQDGLPPMKNK